MQRSPDAHKGNFGHVFVLAGSARFSGAAVLCAAAAMRSGAGLVTLGIPESLNSTVIKIKPKEVMTLPLAETKEQTLSPKALAQIKKKSATVDILAIGPGLSRNPATQQLVRKLIISFSLPVVLDADGINAFTGQTKLLRKHKGKLIITPHPGELARLINVSVKEIQKNRIKIAKKSIPVIDFISLFFTQSHCISDERR